MSAPLSEKLLADITRRHAAAEGGGWYLAPESFAVPGTVRATIGGVPLTVAVMDFRGWKAEENREFVLHAHDDVRVLLGEAARLRASAEGAHRRINEVLDYLAGKDAAKLSEDAGAMGFHIVAVLDSPPRADEEAPVRPALPWASLLTDAEASDLVSELASLFLDYWRGDRPDDVATLREVGRLLAEHRDRAARELAQVTAEVPHAAPCRYPSSPECTCKTEDAPARTAIFPDGKAAFLARKLSEESAVVSALAISPTTVELHVRPASLDEWEFWQRRFHVEPGRATHRGSFATAAGTFGTSLRVQLTGVGVGALYAAERDRVGGESS